MVAQSTPEAETEPSAERAEGDEDKWLPLEGTADMVSPPRPDYGWLWAVLAGFATPWLSYEMALAAVSGGEGDEAAVIVLVGLIPLGAAPIGLLAGLVLRELRWMPFGWAGIAAGTLVFLVWTSWPSGLSSWWLFLPPWVIMWSVGYLVGSAIRHLVSRLRLIRSAAPGSR